eukprot:scaffold119865_cov33-Prasinocladus_malaysianus.AAC.1
MTACAGCASLLLRARHSKRSKLTIQHIVYDTAETTQGHQRTDASGSEPAYVETKSLVLCRAYCHYG